jgi:hypothetical protein
MGRACRFVFWGFAFLYGVALLLLLIGTFGWFGQDQDPLSGVFLLPLGLPWVQVIDRFAEPGPWIPIIAPLINLFLIRFVCRVLSKAR